MNEETQGTEGSEESAAPAGGGRAEMSEKRHEPQPEEALERGLDNQPKPPRYAPAPGLRHTYDPAQKIWRVERDPNFKEDGTPAAERGEQKSPTPDAQPGTADESGGLTLGEHLPPAIREDPQAHEMLREVSTALDDSRIETGAKQRLVDIAMDLHSADLEAGMPALWNREANEGVLQQRWGAAYPERVARAQAAAKALGPKFLAWCDRTQAGNSPALIETLALMADKDKILSLSPEQAAAKMKEWRSDPKSPLRNSLHPEHAVALAKARVLAIIAEGKGRQGNVEELVKDRQAAEAKAKGEPLDDATAKLDAEITAIRLDKGYSSPSAANHKALVARMQELMRQRWPD
jgi:hypothetical protein